MTPIPTQASLGQVPIATTVEELRKVLAAWRAQGTRTALIPTMGALHDGHLSHLSCAKTRADRVLVSIYVNPTQFGPNEDFSRYPRDLAADRAKLEAAGGVDLLYAPGAHEIYPEGFATNILIDGPARGLESDFRPQFFAGVGTVVAKLLPQTRPDFVTFGEKDYQQLLVVRQLVRDLDLGIEILPVPTAREPDGLALSSRNAYLSQDERKNAASLYRTLNAVAERARGGRGVPEAEAEGAADLLSAGFDRVDYVALRDANTLQPLHDIRRPARALAAAWLGTTRLIDNVAV